MVVGKGCVKEAFNAPHSINIHSL